MMPERSAFWLKVLPLSATVLLGVYLVGNVRPVPGAANGGGGHWPYRHETAESRLFSLVSQVPLREFFSEGTGGGDHAVFTFEDGKSDACYRGKVHRLPAGDGLSWVNVSLDGRDVSVLHLLDDGARYLFESVECYVFYEDLIPVRLLFLGLLATGRDLEVTADGDARKVASPVGTLGFAPLAGTMEDGAVAEGLVRRAPVVASLEQTNCRTCHAELASLDEVPRMTMVAPDLLIESSVLVKGRRVGLEELDKKLYHWRHYFGDGEPEIELRFVDVDVRKGTRDSVLPPVEVERGVRRVRGWEQIGSLSMERVGIESETVFVRLLREQGGGFP